MNLPEVFKVQMQKMLGDEYDDFMYSYNLPVFKGLRLNTLKCDLHTLECSLPFPLSPSKFSPHLFHVHSVEKIGYLAAHHAGMFYAQEPSASSAVTVLAPKPGDMVLDLCAAPGGKTTQIAAALEGDGLVWSNEIVRSRANILLSNIERMGIRNAVISSVHPEKLCTALAGFFDKVLVDAPCSGEGMFKKEPQAIAAWSESSVRACAARQLSILNSAANAVRNHGILVYSTCTFSIAENEETVISFLKDNPEFELVEIDTAFGRGAFGIPALRIFPMDGGEGHFVAKMRRNYGGISKRFTPFHNRITVSLKKDAGALYGQLFTTGIKNRLLEARERLYLIPDGLPELPGISVIRAGVLLGTVKGRRIEPSHHLFMSRGSEEIVNRIEFELKNENERTVVYDFLRGEEIDCDKKGYTAVCINGVVTGFGKASSGRLKNHYPKGLRNLR